MSDSNYQATVSDESNITIARAVDAVWHDANSSNKTSVQLTINSGVIVITDQHGFRRQTPLTEVKISSRLANTPRLLTFSDGVVLQVSDNDYLDDALQNNRAGWIHTAETRWRWIFILLVLSTIILYFAYTDVLPAIAKQVEKTIPAEAVGKLSQDAYQNMIENKVIKTTTLSDEQQKEITALFISVQKDIDSYADEEQKKYTPKLKLHWFGWGTPFEEFETPDEPRDEDAQLPEEKIEENNETDDVYKGLANGFAFPDGTIVLTDALVTRLTDDEIKTVIAHEIGHVYLRHGMLSVIQGIGIYFIIGLLAGDYSGVSAIPAVLAHLGYSRDFEAEADCFAYQYMQRQGLSPLLLSEALDKLMYSTDEEEESNKADEPDTTDEDTSTNKTETREDNALWLKVIKVLSTHPTTEERANLENTCPII